MQIRLIILIVLFCAVLAAGGQIFFKIASKNFSFNPASWIKNPAFILGVFLYASSAILFVWSLKFGNLSVLYPLIATSYIWVTLFAGFIFKEDVSLLKWAGIILIIAGIIVITR